LIVIGLSGLFATSSKADGLRYVGFVEVWLSHDGLAKVANAAANTRCTMSSPTAHVKIFGSSVRPSAAAKL
jgi:hypothetical protein